MPSPRGKPRSAASTEAVLAILAVLPFLAAPRESGAVQDPSLKWMSLETEHFRISYHEGLEAVAQRTAAAAEESHRRLSKVLGHEPKGRTEISISDETDDANGWAITVPFNQIHLWATAPDDMSPLMDYDDWYLGLVIHEYAHILHMDTFGGIAKVINAIFGKVYPPNGVQPRWIIEGLAVVMESDHTGGGRLKTTQWDMMMRAGVLEDRFLPVDSIAIGPLGWPHGTAIYLYGSYFLRYVAGTYGEEALAAMSHEYGKSLIPFGINRTIRDVTGKTWLELYDDWYAAAKEEYGAQAEEVRGRGLMEGMRITDTGELDLSPRFSPDGSRIAWFSWDGHDRSGLLTIDLEGPGAALAGWDGEEPAPAVPKKGWKTGSLAKITGQGAVAWTPDGKGLVYARSEVFRNWYAFHDLYHLDLVDGSISRITEGGRTRQPDVSPDGKLFAYTVNGAGTSRLVVATAGPDPVPVLEKDAGGFGQVYSPRFSPDGKRIAYSSWSEGGLRDIHVIDVATGKDTAITSDRFLDTGPAWDPGGKYLYFCSDRTGISNVYALDLEAGGLWMVTNVLTGAFEPDVSPDGRTLVYVGYHSRGYDLYLMEIDPGGWLPAGDPGPDAPVPDMSWNGIDPEPVPKPYNPLRTLLPRYWSLMVAEDGYGYGLSVFTTGMDMAGHHSIAATFTSGLDGRLRLEYAFDYAFLKLPFDVRLSHSRAIAPRWGLRIDDEWKTWPELRYTTGITLGIPLYRADWMISLDIGYRFSWIESDEPLEIPVDPNAALPHLPDRGWISGFTAGFWFSNARGSLYGTSIEEGMSIWARVHADLPELGSDYRAVSVDYGLAAFLEMPWLRHHVIALRIAGGYAWSNFERRGYYSLGGFPNEDIVMDLVNRIRMSGVALRGYPPGAAWGDQYYLLNLEYRLPIASIFRGLETLPWQLDRIFMSVFSDAGAAFGRGLASWDGVLVSVGGEVFVTMTLGYWEGVAFRVGYARGLMKKGKNDFYVVLSTPF